MESPMSPDSSSDLKGPLVPRAVVAIARSANKKTGPVAITYVSQHSCSRTCPFRGSGCYAELGPIGIMTRRLNGAAVMDPVELARLEAAAIDGLPADRPLRLHGVGDCRTRRAARIVSAACRRYRARGEFLLSRGLISVPAVPWTYTHSWRDVPVSSWDGVSVLASCESPAQASEAVSAGYAPAVVVGGFHTQRAFRYGAVTAIPCPNQTSGVTCGECRLCLDAPRLSARRMGIAFAAHGTGAGRVMRSLAVINRPAT